MTGTKIPADVIERCIKAAHHQHGLDHISIAILHAAGWPELVAERDRLSELNGKLTDDFNRLLIHESHVCAERDRLLVSLGLQELAIKRQSEVIAELVSGLREAQGNVLAGRGTWAVACIDALLAKAEESKIARTVVNRMHARAVADKEIAAAIASTRLKTIEECAAIARQAAKQASKRSSQETMDEALYIAHVIAKLKDTKP